MKFSAYDPWSNPKEKSKEKDNRPSSRDKTTTEPRGRPNPLGGAESIIDMIKDMFGMGNSSKKNGGSGKRPRGLFSISSVLGVFVFIWAALGIHLIDEQERGVVLRFGKYLSTLEPGLRWQPYLIDRVVVLNITQVRSFSSRGIMLTQDENIVDITVNVQYVVNNPENFVIEIRDPELSLRQATDSSLRHVVGSTVMDQVITEGRAELAIATQQRIQRYVDDYTTGIEIRQVSIQRADPPEQVKASFEDVISAREDKVRFINQATAYSNAIIPQARGEAMRIMEEGAGYKADKIARATGQAQRFDLVYREYVNAPQVTRNRLYLEAMEEVLTNSNKILIDVSEGSNNLLYLPLDQLVNRAPGGSGDISSGRGGADSSSTLQDQNRRAIVQEVLQEIRNQLPRSRTN